VAKPKRYGRGGRRRGRSTIAPRAAVRAINAIDRDIRGALRVLSAPVRGLVK